ncbi:hypothetical protein IAU60_002830 [Kwoniella sp. DSM 27419]
MGRPVSGSGSDAATGLNLGVSRGDAYGGPSGVSGPEQSRKKKKGSASEGKGKVKKTRQSPCRARKVKCDRPPPANSEEDSKEACTHCRHLGLACTFDYKPKKRGPPNLYMRRLQEDSSVTPYPPSPKIQLPPIASATTVPLVSPGLDVRPAASGSSTPHPVKHSTRTWETEIPALYTDHSRGILPMMTQPHPDEIPPYDGSLGHASAQPQPLIHALHPQQRINGHLTFPSSPHLPPDPLKTIRLYVPSQDFADPSQGQNRTNTVQSSASHDHRPSTKPIYTYVHHPFNPSNPFDMVLSRKTLYQVLDLFFDYIYCLIPCLHRPTFTHDINTKREERPDQEEWTALVFAIVGSTLVQLPRNFVSMTRKEVRELVLACHGKVRDYLSKDFHEISITRTIIVYHAIFCSRMTGKMFLTVGELGMNYSYLLALRAHEEKTYSHLNPMSRIFQRRIFWLMYGADKSLSAVEGTPVFFHEDDCLDVAFPEEIDDEYITEHGLLSQPKDYTPLLSGFAYISKLHRITGQLLDKHRRDRLRPPNGLMLQVRLNEVNELYDRTVNLMQGCPPHLQLDYAPGRTKSVDSLSPGWDSKAKEDIAAISTDPASDSEVLKDCDLIQQANIYVTQQFVRLMILQYRDELYELKAADQSGDVSSTGSTYSARHASERRSAGLGELTSSHEKDQVIIDLLAILRKIPLKVLAVNSFPIVSKVQFIASTLLDAIDSQETGTIHAVLPMTTDSKMQKAQRNLWQFLNILSEIEGLYSLADDPTCS